LSDKKLEYADHPGSCDIVFHPEITVKDITGKMNCQHYWFTIIIGDLIMIKNACYRTGWLDGERTPFKLDLKCESFYKDPCITILDEELESRIIEKVRHVLEIDR